MIVHAASPDNFKELIGLIVFDLVNPLIFLVGSLAFLAFFWGIAKYIFSAGDEQKKASGKDVMLYGLIALFVMVSVWGLIGILRNTFFEGAPEPIETNQGDGNTSLARSSFDGVAMIAYPQ
jgi:hypothetical protein